MEQAQALQVKAERDITNCKAAVAEAAQKLQCAQQEAAEAAEAAGEAAVRLEKKKKKKNLTRFCCSCCLTGPYFLFDCPAYDRVRKSMIVFFSRPYLFQTSLLTLSHMHVVEPQRVFRM